MNDLAERLYAAANGSDDWRATLFLEAAHAIGRRAWDYPPRGGSRLSCGCWQPYPHAAYELVTSWDWEGGELVETSGCYCPFHALKIKVSGAHIETWAPDEDDPAQGIEAPSGGETRSGSTEGKSPVAAGHAPAPCIASPNPTTKGESK